MDMARFATLRTARLMLIPLSDVEPRALAAALDDFDVTRWLARVPHPYTLTDARDFIARCRADRPPRWAILEGGALVGGVGLDPHLGYWIARRAWGRGIATEAARAVLAGHFDDPDAGAVDSSHFTDNHGSRRVLEKLGFRDTGACDIPSLALARDVAGRAMRLERHDWTGATIRLPEP